MRFFLIPFAALMLAAAAGPAKAQLGYDRPGGDYTRFQIANGDPAACAARCERDSHCRAWAFSYPRTNFALATCWLKSRVTPRKQMDCCVIGRARRRRGRAAKRRDRIFHRPARRRLSSLRACARSRRRSAARRRAKAKIAAAPGPMCGPAMAARRRRAAI